MFDIPIARQGDKTSHGGVVITASSNTFSDDRAVACVGDLVSCPIKGHGINPIITGAEIMRIDGREVAVHGSLTACGATLIASQTNSFVGEASGTAGDTAAGGVAAAATATAFLAPEEMASKQTNEFTQLADDQTETEAMCPNMSNEEFCALVMRLRDQAVDLIENQRLPELQRWDAVAQARTRKWFGAADQELRGYLQNGLRACARVLRGMTCENFVRYSDKAVRNIGCVPTAEPDRAAAVCKPDVKTHTIAIELKFCKLPDNKNIFGTNVIIDGDSKLLTLVHETTHFNDTFGSHDHWYYTRNSRGHARHPDSRNNAENLAAYILGVTNE